MHVMKQYGPLCLQALTIEFWRSAPEAATCKPGLAKRRAARRRNSIKILKKSNEANKPKAQKNKRKRRKKRNKRHRTNKRNIVIKASRRSRQTAESKQTEEPE